METAYVLTFPAFVALVGGFLWMQYRRNLSKQDSEELKIADKLRSDVDKLIERSHLFELELAKRATWDALEAFKRELKDDFKDLKTEIKEDFENAADRILSALHVKKS